MSAADVKELFTRELVNRKGLETQSSVKNTHLKTSFYFSNSFSLAFPGAAFLRS